jgi:hypothetical protein
MMQASQVAAAKARFEQSKQHSSVATVTPMHHSSTPSITQQRPGASTTTKQLPSVSIPAKPSPAADYITPAPTPAADTITAQEVAPVTASVYPRMASSTLPSIRSSLRPSIPFQAPALSTQRVQEASGGLGASELSESDEHFEIPVDMQTNANRTTMVPAETEKTANVLGSVQL